MFMSLLKDTADKRQDQCERSLSKRQMPDESMFTEKCGLGPYPIGFYGIHSDTEIIRRGATHPHFLDARLATYLP
jgi:hypothetical protein